MLTVEQRLQAAEDYLPNDDTPEYLRQMWLHYGVVPGPIFTGRANEVEEQKLHYVASFPYLPGKTGKIWMDLYVAQPQHPGLEELREKLKQEGNGIHLVLQAPVGDAWYYIFDSDSHIESSPGSMLVSDLLSRKHIGNPWHTAANILLASGVLSWRPLLTK